jgi:hypothetical protein
MSSDIYQALIAKENVLQRSLKYRTIKVQLNDYGIQIIHRLIFFVKILKVRDITC